MEREEIGVRGEKTNAGGGDFYNIVEQGKVDGHILILSYKISPLQHVTDSVLKINSANITSGCVKRRGTGNERQIITTVLTLTYLFFWNNDYRMDYCICY